MNTKFKLLIQSYTQTKIRDNLQLAEARLALRIIHSEQYKTEAHLVQLEYASYAERITISVSGLDLVDSHTYKCTVFLLTL